MNFSLVVVGVFSGFWETKRRKILIYFWYVGAGGGAGGAVLAYLLACPLVAGGQGALAILLTSAR